MLNYKNKIHGILLNNMKTTENNLYVNSGKTAISRVSMSAPFKNFLNTYGDTIKNKSILDYGCGKGVDVREASKLGYSICGYDPNNENFPELSGKFDIVYCGYVINVINLNDRECLIKNCWDKINGGGMMVIVARTSKEIESNAKKNAWVPCDDGFITPKGTFQKGFDRVELSNLIQNCLKDENFIVMTTTNFDCNCSGVIVRNLS